MEEGRGRRYKEGDRMVERGDDFGEYLGENFCRRRRREDAGTEGMKTRGGG